MTSPDSSEPRLPTGTPSASRSSILLSYLCTFLFWGAIYIYMPILSPYAKHVGGSLQAAGLVMGAYGLSQILLRIPLGVWSDRLRRRKPFILLGFLLLLYTATLFVLAPVAVPWLSLRAWWV